MYLCVCVYIHFCYCCFDYSDMLRTKYYTQSSMLPIILLCCSFFVVAIVHRVFSLLHLHLFLWGYEKVCDAYVFMNERVCVSVCKSFLHFVLLHMHNMYMNLPKNKTTNRKTKWKYQKKLQTVFWNICMAKGTPSDVYKTYTPKDLYDKGKRYVNFIKGSKKK